MLVVIMMVFSSLACGYWQSIAMAEGLENTESEEEPVLGPFEFADMSEEEDEPEQGLSAVSYTHLDVYKRQLLVYP